MAIHYVSMTVGSTIRVLLSANKPHPLRKSSGVQVDYGIASVILPSCIFGANLGVIVNLMLSELVVLGFLTLVLVYITVITGRKWHRVRSLERRSQQIDPDARAVAASDEHETERKLKNESPQHHDKDMDFNDPEEIG